MSDLVARIRAALDETERIARAATPGPWRWGDWSATFGTLEQEPYILERAPGIGPFPAIRLRDEECEEVLRTEPGADEHEANRTHIARHDPAAVLRRCAADRKILDLHRNDGGDCSTCRGEPEREVLWDGTDETWSWTSPPVKFPCGTVLALAEAYGIEEEQ